MNDELPEHRVAVVVFASVRAVDLSDATGIARVAIQQSLRTCSINHPSALTTVQARFPGQSPAPVHVHRVEDLGSATYGGYLGTKVTDRAYRE